MTIKRFIKLVISGFYKFPHLLRHNRMSWTSEVTRGSLFHGCNIGKYTYIGPYCNLLNADIGNYCSIAPGVQIGGMEHAIYDLSTNTWLTNKGDDTKRTTIGPDVWIAAGSIIRQGVCIGQGAVVGANSFVNKDVPPYAIVVGSPAKIVRYRFETDVIDELMNVDFQLNTPPDIVHNKLEVIRRKFNL